MRAVSCRLRSGTFVLETDVASNYASIDHLKLLDRLAAAIRDRGGLYFEFRRGIPLGCPLSPLLGAFFLAELDARLEATGQFFVRYMDDVIVLAPTRWKLWRAVKVLNETFAALDLAKHPDKTFIGRVEQRFDFLGYRLSPEGITVAEANWQRFVERALRLYEQDRGKPCGSPRLDEYVRRRRGWGRGGLQPATSR